MKFTVKLICNSLAIALISLLHSCATAQSTTSQVVTENTTSARPKLIVGITVDQMRYDYIEKFWNDFSEEGFKKLVNEGFFARNLHYNYMPTYTGPGHAAIFTGTSPAYNGIVANDWYEKSTGRMVYCSADSTVLGVGSKSVAGQMSPHYLLSSTIGDELKLFSNNRSKVIGIAMKDRGAILPAGRTADAAYWFVGAQEGVWSSSTWYMDSLPNWVNQYNKLGKPESYMNQSWTLLKDISVYDESMPDNNAYELPFKGTIKPVFPYNLSELRALNNNYDLIKATPFGNSLTVDFGKQVILNENFGKDEFTDLLCMSFSCTDYAGHQFGIHSKEVQDTYLRLDLEIAEFISFLDKEIGKGNYIIFLAADHAGAPTPSYMMEQKGAAGYWKSDKLEEQVQQYLVAKYGEGQWILNETNQNIFLNRTLIREKNLDLKKIQLELTEFISEIPNVLMVFNGSDLSRIDSKNPIASMVQLGYNQHLSGDIIYVTDPGYMEYGMQGTTHGSPYTYDTHIPALFYGMNIPHGETFERHSVCDIAPTISSLCRIAFPSACIGNPILPIVEGR